MSGSGTAAGSGTHTNVPLPTSKWIDANGCPTPQFFQAFTSVWQRTGGVSAPVNSGTGAVGVGALIADISAVTDQAQTAGSIGLLALLDNPDTLASSVPGGGVDDTAQALALFGVFGDHYGTMALQDANAVAITGGTINGTAIGGVTPAAGAFTTLSGSVTATGSTTARTLANWLADTINVEAFGAFPGASASTNTASIQAALTYAATFASAVVVIPPGNYQINQCLVQSSGTTIFGYGATLQPVAAGSWTGMPIVIMNYSNAATTLTDHDLAVYGLRFDWTNQNNGGVHAINYMMAQHIRVVDTYCLNGGDHTAFIGCDDTLARGCQAVGISNGGHDHWGTAYRGPSNARVEGCFVNAAAGEGVLWNAAGVGTGTNIAQSLTVSGCQLLNCGVFLDTLLSTASCRDVTIEGNWIGGSIIGRGTISNTNIANNTICGLGAGSAPVIWIDQGADAGGGWTGDPSNTVIAGNILYDAMTTAVNEAVVRLYGGGIFANNTVGPLAAGVVGGAVVGVLLSSGSYYGTSNIIDSSYTYHLVGTLLSGATLPAYVSAWFASAAAPTNAGSYSMQGLGAGVSITPTTTGRVQVTVSGVIVSTSTVVDTGITFQMCHGTGTAPANGAAQTGTATGSVVEFTQPSAATAAGDVHVPFSTAWAISGLTVGTAYWIDLTAQAVTTPSVVSLSQISVVGVEF